MKMGQIFTEKEYAKALKYAKENGAGIKEIDSKEELVEKEIEIILENGEKEIKKIKELEIVRCFQIVERQAYKPTNEDISNMRQQAYQERTDPLTLRKLRKQALNEWTSEDEKEYVAQIKAISAQIASEFPYNSEEPNL